MQTRAVTVSERAPRHESDDAFAPAVLRSTARPPSLGAGTVRRAAVLDVLEATPEGALVLVVAPAGYGKSTTTLQWGIADRR
ncbi:hypothetical protein B7486_55135, partial [cyanobacterium TDX16]